MNLEITCLLIFDLFFSTLSRLMKKGMTCLRTATSKRIQVDGKIYKFDEH